MSRVIDKDQRLNLVGHNVKKYRKLRGMSQQQLADKLELIPVYICRGSLSRLEDQKRTVTDFELAGLARVLEVSILDLFAVD